MKKRFAVVAALLALVLVGCAATPVIRISTVHIDRAEVILARQGVEENQTALQILMNAFVPMAEIAGAVAQPWVGAVVAVVHLGETVTEKAGDAGGDTMKVEAFEGRLDEINIGFGDTGAPETLTVRMQGEE